jgi:hypothetical protein
MPSVLSVIRKTGYRFCSNLEILQLDAACNIMRVIGYEVDNARALHRCCRALTAGEDPKAVIEILKDVAGRLVDQADEEFGETERNAKMVRSRAIYTIADSVEESQAGDTASNAAALESALAAALEWLKRRWGARKSHDTIKDFVLEGKSKLLDIVDNARLFVVNENYAFRMAVPRSFAENGSVVPNLVLYKKHDGAWIPMILSAITPCSTETTELYAAVREKLTTQEVIDHVSEIMLAYIEANGANGANGAKRSLRLDMLTSKSFKLLHIVHASWLGSTGLALCKVCIIPTGPVSPDLATTIADINKSMGGEGNVAPVYFTIEELAVEDTMADITSEHEEPVRYRECFLAAAAAAASEDPEHGPATSKRQRR